MRAFKIRSKSLCLLALLLLVGLIALFPKQIFLRCIEWKAKSYCLETFAAHLLIDSLYWEGGRIILKGGKLKKDQVDASFDSASLLLHISWKERVVSGSLKLEGVKIVHQKKVARPLSRPQSPSFSFFTFQLATTIENGELFLYDSLEKNPIFPYACFDLKHPMFKNEETEMSLRGNTKEIGFLFPESVQRGFNTAFADSGLSLQASLKRADEGLELKGELTITESSEKEHRLFFGNNIAVERSYEDRSKIIEGIHGDFWDRFKLSGWFKGEKFPVEKFISPFLFDHPSTSVAGLVDFEGTFDERYGMVVYHASNLCLSKSSFSV